MRIELTAVFQEVPEGGFVAFVPEMPGAASQGETLEEARENLEDAVRQTVSRTRSLARRQLAWFRRDPRIRWFEVDEAGAVGAVDRIVAHLETT
jgi:predicted RNase H-like HicB family nuclease